MLKLKRGDVVQDTYGRRRHLVVDHIDRSAEPPLVMLNIDDIPPDFGQLAVPLSHILIDQQGKPRVFANQTTRQARVQHDAARELRRITYEHWQHGCPADA